jgi:hypothetical protein
MTQVLQPGQHPDADQLSAFVEHVLPLHEQQQMLAHLASCSDCRAIVYFSQEASLDAPMQPQPIATRKPWFSGWNLFRGWTLAWPAAAALACLVLVTIHLRNAGRGERNNSVDKTAQLEPTLPPLPATPAPAQATQLKTAPTEVQKPLAIVAPAARELDGLIATNAINSEGVSRRKSLNGPSEKGSAAAMSSDALKIESGATASRQSSLGRSSSFGFTSANSEPAANAPAAAAMGGLAAYRSAQAATATSDAALLQPGAAGAAPQSIPPSTATLHSLSQQYNAPPPAPPPPMPSSSAMPGSVNETVTVTSAAASIETENAASTGGIAGAGFGSLQSRKSLMMKKQPILPSHLPALSTISNAGQELAIDTAGTLFRSGDAGATWQPVAVQWTGRAVKITLVSSPNQRLLAKDTSPAAASSAAAKPSATAPAPAIFELTNDAGELWTSTDGQVWKHK